MQGEAARRAGEPSGEGEEAAPQGLDGHDLLAQADPPRPTGQVMRHHLYREPGGVSGEAARGEMVQPHAVLEVSDGILDLGVAAMISLQFQGFPVPVGDEGVIAVVDQQGQLRARGGLHPLDDEPHRCGAGLTPEGGVFSLGHVGGALHPVGDGRPVPLGDGLDLVAQASALADGDGVANVHLTERWNSATVAATQTSHRHTGPTPGATHEYRVRAENAGGVSQWSEIATAVWYRTAAPPKKFTLTPLGAKLFVQWPKSDTPGVTGYQLRYRIDSGEWQYQDTTSLLYFADWSTGQTLHEYQVRALKDKAAGDWSAIERATVATPAAVPALTFNREGASSVRLHWEKPASGQPKNYIVQTRDGNSNEYSTVSGTGGHITTVRMPTEYDSETTYRVLAQNHFGIKGPQKEGVTAHVVIPAAERQWKDAPQNLEALMLDPTTVRLTWNPPQERAGEVTNYRIYRKLASDSLRIGDSYRDHVLVAYTRGPSTSHIDHSAQAGVACEYTVKAYRDGQSSPWGANAPLVHATPWE